MMREIWLVWGMLVMGPFLAGAPGPKEFCDLGVHLAQGSPNQNSPGPAGEKEEAEIGLERDSRAGELRNRNLPKERTTLTRSFEMLFQYLRLILVFLVSFYCAISLVAPHTSRHSGNVSSLGSGSVLLAGSTAFISLVAIFGEGEVNLRELWVSNLILSALAWGYYAKNGQPGLTFAWPFLAGAVVAVFMSRGVALPPRIFLGLLTAVLFADGFRLVYVHLAHDQSKRCPSYWMVPGMLLGGVLALFPVLLGMGGGLHLRSFLGWFHWTTDRVASSASLLYMMVVSALCLGVHGTTGQSWGPLALSGAAAFLGGMGGIQVAVSSGKQLHILKIPSRHLKKGIGLLAWIAAVKILLQLVWGY